MPSFDAYINNHRSLRSDIYLRLGSMSELLTHLTSSHLEKFDFGEAESPAVFLVGSVGRGEFILGKSDLDFVFVNLDDGCVDRIMWSIHQSAMPLLRLDPGGASDKIAGGRVLPDFRKYFPTIAEEALLKKGEPGHSDEAARRRIQLLFEGRRIWGQASGLTIQEKCIEYYGLLRDSRSGVPLVLDDIDKLEIEIQKTATTYYGWKTKKYLGLRIPQELGRRLALLAAIYHKSAWRSESHQTSVYLQLLQRRTVNAILFWENHFLFGTRFAQYKDYLDLKPTNRGNRNLLNNSERTIKRLVRGAVNAHTRLVELYCRSELNETHSTLSDTEAKEIRGTLDLFLDNALGLLQHLNQVFDLLEEHGVFDFRNSSLSISIEATIRYIVLRKNQTARWFSCDPI